MTKKADKALIEKLKSGNIFLEKPKETDPTKNKSDYRYGGGGDNGSKK